MHVGGVTGTAELYLKKVFVLDKIPGATVVAIEVIVDDLVVG